MSWNLGRLPTKRSGSGQGNELSSPTHIIFGCYRCQCFSLKQNRRIAISHLARLSHGTQRLGTANCIGCILFLRAGRPWWTPRRWMDNQRDFVHSQNKGKKVSSIYLFVDQGWTRHERLKLLLGDSILFMWPGTRGEVPILRTQVMLDFQMLQLQELLGYPS